MKASETSFQPIMEGTKQYVVPLFQRAYSWERKEWDVLWDDLVYLCEHGQPKTHFIGSVVTMPLDPAPEGVARFLLIDGQQRLTTLFVLLAVLRDSAAANGQTEVADEINQTMLVNPFKKGLDHFKLLPTQVDRAAFQGVIVRDSPDPQSLVVRCYQYFERKLRQGGVTIAALKDSVVGRLSVVSIKLDGDDNPHLVFESLNWKGRPLTQADLIRNYFFMRIPAADQEEMHAKHWVPMQQSLGDNLTEFIRHYLMRSGAVVKQSDVYFTLKARTEKGDALAALQDLAIFAGYYHRLVAPEHEPNVAIRAAMLRLNHLEVTTAYPFLLDCYHDYSRGKLSAGDLLGILQTIENYIVRRFVCNVPTNQLNKIFPVLYSQAQLQAATGFVTGVRRAMQRAGIRKTPIFDSD